MRVFIKKFIAIVVFVAVMTFCFANLFACNVNTNEYIRFTSLRFFNTNFDVTVFADKNKDGEALEKLFYDELCAVAEEVENLMSISVESSDVSRYNRSQVGEKTQISQLTAYVLGEALDYYEKTNGAYNPAVAQLVDLWGFSPRFKDVTIAAEGKPYDRQKIDGKYDSLPDEKYITAFISLTDLSNFEIERDGENCFITKTCPSVIVDGVEYTQAMDLGGIAKGYVVDECVRILREYGYEYGLVTLGSSSLSLMSYFDTDVMKKKEWKVSVASPTNRQPILSFKEENCGISTSGTYENCYFVDGKEYGHIIDASIGKPTDNGTVSVTVSGLDALGADALTTALCVMDLQSAIEFVQENLMQTSTIILVRDGKKFKAYSTLQKSKIECSKLISDVQLISTLVSQ